MPRPPATRTRPSLTRLTRTRLTRTRPTRTRPTRTRPGRSRRLGRAAALLAGAGTLALALILSPATLSPAKATAAATHSNRATSAAAASPADGSVAALGTAALGNLAGRKLSHPLVGMAATPDHKGYWLVAADGGVFAFGDARFHGSTGAIHLDQPIVGMAADPATGGYWLVASDGGVFAFDAPFFGSLGGIKLKAPIVGIASSRDGHGYWMVAADGGVFAFGDARFHGSTGAIHLVKPIVGMAVDPKTGGYWLVAADGGTFAFDAPFVGSLGGIKLNAPIVAVAASPTGKGLWLLGSDGGVFNLGKAPFDGADLTTAAAPAVAIAAGKAGYWVTYGSGALIATGPPPPLPAAPNGGPATLAPTAPGVLSGKVIAVDPGHNGGNGADPAFIDTPIFNGVGEESCDTVGAETDAGFAEAQFNFDVAEYLIADLRAAGATVVVTRTTNTGVGPCVTERAAIGNDAHANAAISIHADGGPPGGRGVAILEPVPDGINDAIVGPSAVLGTDLLDAFVAGTGEPISDYDGVNGIQPRDDLGGINLSTVPKVFIEALNLRNATDASLATSQAWQARAGAALAQGFEAFLAD